MTTGRDHQPPGFHAVTLYLIVERADRLVDFLHVAFDAEVVSRSEAEDGTIQNAAMKIGDSILEISEARADWKPMPAAIHLYVLDTDAAYERAVGASATTLYEPADMPYGERSAGVQDPTGSQWFIATYTGDEAARFE